MRLSVRTNEKEVFHDLDAFVDAARSRAIPRGINRLAALAELAGLRKVGDTYELAPRTVEKYLRLTVATRDNPVASITAAGQRFPLSVMQPRQTRKGVSVRIKGKRFVIPHSFLSKALGGTHVFARGGYRGKDGGVRPRGEDFGRFVMGLGRLPISEIYTFGPAETFANEEVVQAMQDRIEEQVQSVFAREIAAVRRGF